MPKEVLGKIYPPFPLDFNRVNGLFNDYMDKIRWSKRDIFLSTLTENETLHVEGKRSKKGKIVSKEFMNDP